MIAQPETIQEVLFNALRALGATDDYRYARLEAELLLAHALGISRALLLARLSEPVDLETNARFAALVARRAKHEPLAYVLGHQEFFGLDFIVDRRVLIPRPETELLVERALEILEHAPQIEPTVVDVGTGSGAIIISLASRVPRAKYIASDISRDALDVARVNAERLGVAARVEFREGDLLEPLRVPLDLLLANLPYISHGRQARLSRQVRDFEPKLAFDGGLDGLGVIRRLLEQIKAHLSRVNSVLLEINDEQGADALAVAREKFPRAEIKLHKDMEKLDRLLEIQI